MILVATIEHSGTFALLNLLAYKERNLRPLKEGPAELLFAHLWDQEMEAILDFKEPIITTYRHPDLIKKSWENRGKDLNELTKQFANYERLLERKPFVVTIWQ